MCDCFGVPVQEALSEMGERGRSLKVEGATQGRKKKYADGNAPESA